MFKAVSRVLFLAVMLVAFIGQVLAFNTSMSCETSVESHYLIQQHKLENNNTGTIKTDSAKECCNIECCDMDCVCMAHVCSSSTYFSTDVGLNKTVVVGEKLYTPNVEQSKSIITLLYRPPIFIS